MLRAADPAMQTPLRHRIGIDVSADRVAGEMLSILQEIEVLLVPIIGARGVDALFQRSVHLACTSHGWLAAADSTDSLIRLLAGRPAAEATAGAESYLREFQNLLCNLIGPALTERLLPAGWAVGSPPSTSQEPP
jgi:hypothetical protein